MRFILDPCSYICQSRERASEQAVRVPSESATERVEGIATSPEEIAREARISAEEDWKQRPDVLNEDGEKQRASGFSRPIEANANLMGATTMRTGTEKGGPRRKVPSSPDQPLEAWEREEMESMLADLVGNIGEYSRRQISRLVLFLQGDGLLFVFLFLIARLGCLLIRAAQFYFPPNFSKEKISQIISCLIPTGRRWRVP